jgi:hypothetical protein
MAVIFPIVSTFDAAGVNKAQRAFKGLGGVAKVSALAFAGLGAATTKFGFDAVKAAAEDQKAQLKLAKTLQNVTGATDQAIAATEQFITAQQFATGVNDSELRPALENLVRATGDISAAQDLLKLSLDVSAGSGRDLSTVSLGLTRALGGNFASLSKLGIVLPENIKKSKDFGQVQEYLNGLFGGQAAVAADTFAGKLAIMREKLTEAQETIGTTLIPILTKLVDYFLNNVMPAIDAVVRTIQFEGAGAGLQLVITNIATVITNLEGTAKKIKDLILLFLGIKTVAPLILGLAAQWSAVSTAIGVTATTTQIATGVMKRALISTGIGALIVAAGFLAAKIYDIAIASQSAEADITITSNKMLSRFGDMANAAHSVVIKMDEISRSARHATDAVENARLGVTTTPVRQPSTFVPGGDSAAQTAREKAAQKKAKDAAKAAADLAKKIADNMAKQVAKATALTTRALEKMNDKLTAARDKLQLAKDAFASFRDGVRDSITGLISFSDAQSSRTGNFLKNLRKQAEGAVSFAAKVKQLIKMGLSETGIQQVLAAGADAGGKIADELIAGGAGAIEETNKLLTSVDKAALALGKAGANQFYKAGITQGQAMVDGIIAGIKAAGFVMSGGVAALPKPLRNALKSGKLTSGQAQEIMNLVGNSQAVTANNRSAQGTTINLTVNAGMGANGTTIGKDIVDAIKKYERTSGPVFLSA